MKAATTTARRLVLLLLVSVLAALGLSAPAQAVAVQPTDEGVAVEHAFVNAVAPARAATRLAEAPLLKVHGPAELVPSPGPAPALMRVGGQDPHVTQDVKAAQRPTAGDRAPPSQQADLWIPAG